MRIEFKLATKPLYPTMDSIQEVNDFIKAQMPITTISQLNSVIGTYHNTLLKVMSEHFSHD